MADCKSYHLYDKWTYTYDRYTGQPEKHSTPVGVCWGTKEQDECLCGGNRCNCDFYPEVRESSGKDTKLTIEDIKQKLESAIEHIRNIDTSGYISDENHKAEAITILMNILKEIDKHED